MSTSAHDLTRTVLCKEPGCEQEAAASTGIYGLLCTQHADAKRKARTEAAAQPKPKAGRNLQHLTELIQLAKDADKLEQKATRLPAQARKATQDALTARQRYQAALREALTSPEAAA